MSHRLHHRLETLLSDVISVGEVEYVPTEYDYPETVVRSRDKPTRSVEVIYLKEYITGAGPILLQEVGGTDGRGRTAFVWEHEDWPDKVAVIIDGWFNTPLGDADRNALAVTKSYLMETSENRSSEARLALSDLYEESGDEDMARTLRTESRHFWFVHQDINLAEMVRFYGTVSQTVIAMARTVTTNLEMRTIADLSTTFGGTVYLTEDDFREACEHALMEEDDDPNDYNDPEEEYDPE